MTDQSASVSMEPDPVAQEIQIEPASTPATVPAPVERAIGARRACGAPGEQPSDGLLFGSYVPTQREIDSGEFVIEEVVAVVRAEGIETNELQPLEDWDTAVKEVSQYLFTKDWNRRFDILHCARKLIKFKPSMVAHLIADFGKCMVECLKNPRSSILREAGMLSADLLTSPALMDIVCETIRFDLLVPVLLLKSISDKKFIRDATRDALHSHAHSAPHMFKVYIESSEHKNSKIAASASHIVALCLEHLCDRPQAQLSQEDFNTIAKIMLQVSLHGKLADTRKSGKRCLELLEAKVGAAEFLQSLQPLCSPQDIETVHRLMHPEELVDEAANITSLADLIAHSSPANSPKSSNGTGDCAGGVFDVILVSETRDRRGSTPRERRSEDEVIQMF